MLASITAREGVEKDSMDLLLKFRKQTVRRLQHLQDVKKVRVLFFCPVLSSIVCLWLTTFIACYIALDISIFFVTSFEPFPLSFSISTPHSHSF